MASISPPPATESLAGLPETAGAVLRRTEQVLRTNGRHIGYYYDRIQRDIGVPAANRRVCVIGAINIAVGLPPHTRWSTCRDDLRARLASQAGTLLVASLGSRVDDIGHTDPDLDPDDNVHSVLVCWHDGRDGWPALSDQELFSQVGVAAQAADAQTALPASTA